MSVGRSSSSQAPLNVVDPVHYIAGRCNANMSWIFLEIRPGNLLEICSVKFVDTLYHEHYQVHSGHRKLYLKCGKQFWMGSVLGAELLQGVSKACYVCSYGRGALCVCHTVRPHQNDAS